MGPRRIGRRSQAPYFSKALDPDQRKRNSFSLMTPFFFWQKIANDAKMGPGFLWRVLRSIFCPTKISKIAHHSPGSLIQSFLQFLFAVSKKEEDQVEPTTIYQWQKWCRKTFWCVERELYVARSGTPWLQKGGNTGQPPSTCPLRLAEAWRVEQSPPPQIITVDASQMPMQGHQSLLADDT